MEYICGALEDEARDVVGDSKVRWRQGQQRANAACVLLSVLRCTSARQLCAFCCLKHVHVPTLRCDPPLPICRAEICSSRSAGAAAARRWRCWRQVRCQLLATAWLLVVGWLRRCASQACCLARRTCCAINCAPACLLLACNRLQALSCRLAAPELSVGCSCCRVPPAGRAADGHGGGRGRQRGTLHRRR